MDLLEYLLQTNNRLLSILEANQSQMEQMQRIILHLMRLPSEPVSETQGELLSTGRNEEELDDLVSWDGIIPESVLDEIVEREFLEQEGYTP